MTDKRDDFDVFEGAPASHNVVALKPLPNKQRLRIVLTLAEFLAQYSPPDYLIDRLLQRGYLYALTGATGAGKTALALLIAVLVAMRRGGQKFGPYEVEPGRVLYITRENPTDVRMRMIVMAGEMGLDPADLDFLVIEQIRTLDKKVLRQIGEEIEEHGDLALVIVETSFALFQGDEENSNAQVGQHARMQRELCKLRGNPCVLTLCHPIKNATTKESLIPRGGGAFLAEVDGNLCVLPGDERIVELHWTGKLRGPDFDKLSFRLKTLMSTKLTDRKGRILPTVMAEVVSEGQVEEAEAKAMHQENILVEAMSEDPDGSLAEWARKCGWLSFGSRDDPPQPNKSQVRRVLDRLIQQKLVAHEGRSYVLKKAGEKAAGTRKPSGGKGKGV